MTGAVFPSERLGSTCRSAESEFLATDPVIRFRFPALPDFLTSSVGLGRGSLSLVSTTEELLGRNISGSGLKSREYGRWDQSRWPRGNL
jgi:hypothetical protein